MTATKPQPKPIKPPEPSLEDPAVVLTHGEMQDIGRLLGKNLCDKEGLLKAITAATNINIDGVEVNLEPRLLQRLKSRCLKGQSFPEWLRDVTIRQLHDYAGY